MSNGNTSSRDVSAMLTPTPVVHRLAVALRFVDVFTDSPIEEPLVVTIPALRKEAYRSTTDATYRFLFTNTPLPASAAYTVEVESSGGYVNLETISVQIPRPGTPHPPPVLRSEYLVEAPLWPTRSARAPVGETIVIGQVASAGGADVDGFRVRLFEPPGPPTPAPYTRCNHAGDFVFRFPSLTASVSGGVVTSTVSIDMELRNAADVPVPVTSPAGAVTFPLGQTTFQRYEIA